MYKQCWPAIRPTAWRSRHGPMAKVARWPKTVGAWRACLACGHRARDRRVGGRTGIQSSQRAPRRHGWPVEQGEEDEVSPRRGGNGGATRLARGSDVSQRQTADDDQQRPGSVPEARRERGEGSAPVNLKGGGGGARGRAHRREPWQWRQHGSQ
jgi:hypothetical protein